MGTVLGTPLAVFVGMTVVLFGFCAALTGQAVAQTWRPGWHVLPSAFGLAVADRLATAAMFASPLWSLPAFVSALVYLTAVTALAWRLTLVHKMVTQYPWLYERAGPLAWRERQAAAGP